LLFLWCEGWDSALPLPQLEQTSSGKPPVWQLFLSLLNGTHHRAATKWSSIFHTPRLALRCMRWFSAASQLTVAARATFPDPVMCGRRSKPSPSYRHIRRRPHTEIASPTPIILVNFGMQLGQATNCLDTGIYAAEEFFPQSGPTILVPAIRLVDVLLRFRRDHELSGHSGSGSCV